MIGIVVFENVPVTVLVVTTVNFCPRAGIKPLSSGAAPWHSSAVRKIVFLTLHSQIVH